MRVLARRAVGVMAVMALVAPAAARHANAWDVACQNESGQECPDPFARAQTEWKPELRAEHRALLDRTIDISGLPQVLRDSFTLEVFALDETLLGKDAAEYPSVRPVPTGAERRRKRTLSIPAMANLPDFAYTFWDLASGNELCPPVPGADALDCHNYETHIGWLNSNHMLPQSRRWYEHLHAIALEQAGECKRLTDAVPLGLRDRYDPYLLACEKQALMLEGVGHHYLQDSWSIGHLWERWGGTEPADFGGDRALGFVVAAFTGVLHGGKAVFDETPGFSALAPWDDPMCAPHENVSYVDHGVQPIEQHPGVGDIFLPTLNGEGALGAGDPYGPQRRSLLGCAVDGIRAVYGATGKIHGPLADPNFADFDLSRSVADDSCWAQRVTNRALAEGCGVHNGAAPEQFRFIPDPISVQSVSPTVAFYAAMQPLIFAQMTIVPLAAGAPPVLNPVKAAQFATDASHACAVALSTSLDPQFADDTDLASGGLPALAGIRPNSAYARGNPASRTPPAFYADPFPPWSLSDSEDLDAPRKEVLNLFFADANAAARCVDFSPTDLEDYVTAVEQARDGGEEAEVIDARCGQCIQMIAPHLRHGVNGDHDTRREALCALVAPDDAAFIYTEENPTSFTGTEPVDYDALQAAAAVRCGCAEAPPDLTIVSASLGSRVQLDDSALIAEEPIVASDGTIDITDLSSVSAVLPSTSVQFEGQTRYTGAGSSSATRSITRTDTEMTVAYFSDRSVTVSIAGDFVASATIGASASDVLCFTLARPVTIEYTASPPALSAFNSTTGEPAFGTGNTSGSATLGAVGRWCLTYQNFNQLTASRQSLSDPAVIEGDPSAHDEYTATFRADP